MSNNDGTDVGAFLIGFLAGGLVGATTALLLAPRSGEETRGQIHQKGVELRGKAEGAFDGAHVKAKAVVADIKRRAEEGLQSPVVLEEGQSLPSDSESHL